MSIANLTRYDCKVVYAGSHQYTDMVPCCLGGYVKFEEAMEASSNSLQQLKAKIAALIPELRAAYGLESEVNFENCLETMRQLSAV